jgi:endonuclease-3 related protein
MEKKQGKMLLEVYKRLYDYFGSRDWWPAESDFEIVLGAILTQNVAWKNVIKAIANIKEAGIFDIEGILEVENEVLEELIRPTRYYKQKAKKLKAFCHYVQENYGGSLEKFFALEKGRLRQELLSIWGIGQETADSIILYAANKPVFVIDAYTKRIFFRLGLTDENITYEELQRFFTENLPEDLQLFNEYHALIVGLGNRVCLTQKPLCHQCPLQQICKKVKVFG